MMNIYKFPCENCIVLAICKAQMHNGFPLRILESKCSLLNNYILQYRPNDIDAIQYWTDTFRREVIVIKFLKDLK